MYKKWKKVSEKIYLTYFSSGGGGKAPSPPSPPAPGERGGVFSPSIMAKGASGGGSGLTEFVSIKTFGLLKIRLRRSNAYQLPIHSFTSNSKSFIYIYAKVTTSEYISCNEKG